MGGFSFELLHYLGNALGSPQGDQAMNMVYPSTNRIEIDSFLVRILVNMDEQGFPKGRVLEQWLPVLGSPYTMDFDADK